MTATTYPEFNKETESLEVATKFAGQIKGKTILVTGVNRDGIGFSTSQAFASQSPSLLIIAGRNPSRVQTSIDALEKEFPQVKCRALQLDLSSQKAVRDAAAELLSWTEVPAVDILVNNAAVMNIPERTLTEDGIEMHFATNHVGHFLFTNLILPKLIKAAEGSPKGATRVVNVSSQSPVVSCIRWSDVNFDKINQTLPEAEQPPYDMHRMWGAVAPEEKSYLPLEGYNQSKVANVLFGIGANKRLFEKYGILSLAIDPGVIQTELSRHLKPEMQAALGEMFKNGTFSFVTLGAGAATTLVAATDPRLGLPESRPEDVNENYGAYLAGCQISDKAGNRAVSTQEADKLWKLSEDLVKDEFVW